MQSIHLKSLNTNFIKSQLLSLFSVLCDKCRSTHKELLLHSKLQIIILSQGKNMSNLLSCKLN